jgi:hypothetical protein
MNNILIDNEVDTDESASHINNKNLIKYKPAAKSQLHKKTKK